MTKTKKYDLIDKIILVAISPLLGIAASGLAFYIFKIIIISIVFLAGFIAAIFFEINFRTFPAKFAIFEKYAIIPFIVLGAIAGVYWAIITIKGRI
jgi:hypothetical protein